MRARAPHILGLAIGAILLPAFLGQSAQGQYIQINRPADETEGLTGNWSATQDDANKFTYYYTVKHSDADGGSDLPPEIICAVSFDINPAVLAESLPPAETSIPPNQATGLEENSWTPIDFEEDRARLVSEVESDLRGTLGAPEARDFVADYTASALPHVSLSAYMDSAVPEPPTSNLLALAALALLPLARTNALKRQYYRQPLPVSASALRR